MCADEQYLVRELKTLGEFEQIGRLQQTVLGIPEDAIFPPKLIYVADENGGAAIGAFDPGGKMVGFVFNFTGSRYGRLIEWSYLLGIAPEARGHGLRRKLKLTQRETVLRKGGRTLCWTIDPLDTVTSAFSFHDLKAVCDEFVVDFPDPVSSRMKNPVIEDRLVARWELISNEVVRIAEEPPPPTPLPVQACVAPPESLSVDTVPTGFRIVGNTVALPSPLGLMETDSAFAPAWRSFLSRAIPIVLAEGFRITDFVPGCEESPGFGWYLLSRG